MLAEIKYQTKQARLQDVQLHSMTVSFNANMRSLAEIIAKFQTRNTNSNKTLSKAFTTSKRALRNEIKEKIDNSIYSARGYADKKDTEFQKEVKESIE